MAITEEFVRGVFAHLETGDREGFMANVADNVDWTVMGTHPLGGRYRSKAEFIDGTYERLHPLVRGMSVMTVDNVLACGDVGVVEMHGNATANNGDPYNNTFCWIAWFENDRIVKVRAYLDSVLVQRLIDGNESAAKA